MIRDVFAEALAAAGAEDQAQFLNLFVRTLDVLCRATKFGSVSMQAHYIAKLLHADTVTFLKDLVDTHEYFRTEWSDEQMARRYERIRELDEQIAKRERDLA